VTQHDGECGNWIVESLNIHAPGRIQSGASTVSGVK